MSKLKKFLSENSKKDNSWIEKAIYRQENKKRLKLEFEKKLQELIKKNS
jgi:hypothetical protein